MVVVVKAARQRRLVKVVLMRETSTLPVIKKIRKVVIVVAA
jgi:hypothetical protein